VGVPIFGPEKKEKLCKIMGVPIYGPEKKEKLCKII
jgi:hypothetical protein